MKLALFCLLAAVLPAAGETRGDTAAPITLYTSFQQEPPPAVMEALQEEVDAIMAPIGLRFEWRKLAGVRGDEVSAELAVVTFQGRCDMAGLTENNKFTGALGWTHVSDGEILPFTDIACDRVGEFVRRALVTVSPAERLGTYGRALGRVLAHELYHIFANTVRHGSSGVAKECYTVQELLGQDFQFQARESRLLRLSRVHPPAGQVLATH